MSEDRANSVKSYLTSQGIAAAKRMKDNEISKSRADKRNYLMLEELNTKPRTTYLSKVTNPNPEVNA